MNRTLRLLPLLLSIFFSSQAQVKPSPTSGQKVYWFTKGLMAVTGSRYGREAIYMDPLAHQLYTNTLKQPTDGSVFGKTEQGQEIKWQSIAADSLNRLRSRNGFRVGSGGPAGPGITPGSIRGGIGTGGGYIYLTYSSPNEQRALLNIKGNSNVYVNGELHMGDAYSMGYLSLPIKLKKGLNEFYVRGMMIIANLTFPEKPVSLLTDDPTLPSIVVGGQNAGFVNDS